MILSILVRWFLKCQCSLLPSSVYHFQFALIHGPNIPGSYVYCFLQHRTLLPSPVTPTTGCCICFGSISSFFLELFPHWFPVAYWTPLPTWGVHLSVSYLFAFSYGLSGSKGKNTEVFCHSLLQWTTFCGNSPPWPIHLEWPHTAWLIDSLS